jgi:hypothetical protein
MDYGPRYRRMAELAATEGLMSMTRRAILRCQFSSGPRTKQLACIEYECCGPVRQDEDRRYVFLMAYLMATDFL